MNNKLIIDIGMHKGEDTGYYLQNGYTVIAVDADPNLIAEAKTKFKKAYNSKQLMLLNYAISDKDGTKVTFNLSQNTIWNSLKENIADRAHLSKNSIVVETRTLSSIIAEYGAPFYCKIDIEGYDEVCLQTLKQANELPQFISVETECVGEGETITDEEALGTLYRLKELGYTKFKLVDQTSFRVLTLNEDFHTSSDKALKFLSQSFGARLKRKIQSTLGLAGDMDETYFKERKAIEKQFNYNFMVGSSGPFGSDLKGEWQNFDEAKQTLLKHRHDYFNLDNAVNYGFWCDWHATK
ncbi:MAG: FkbM family methyltransferase [Bacteroidota bacterium]